MRAKLLDHLNHMRRRSHELRQVAVTERADCERTRARTGRTEVRDELSCVQADVRATALSDVASCLQAALEPFDESELLWQPGETERSVTRADRLAEVDDGDAEETDAG